LIVSGVSRMRFHIMDESGYHSIACAFFSRRF
jgi:hypothetical protein